MNESKKRTSKSPVNPTQVADEEIESTPKPKAEAKVETPAPKKIKEKKLTDKEIAEAIGEAVPPSKKDAREKEVKVPKARKFKTHSEQKKFKLNNVGKK
jgi:hypothetical protein